MPNIFVTIPRDSFPEGYKQKLVDRINHAAAKAEQMGTDPKERFLCWVQVEEVPTGSITCGGVDATSAVIPCIAKVYLPKGVLDAKSKSEYVQMIHAAFLDSLKDGEQRQLMTSVIIHEIENGLWGANGIVWELSDFARAAGYAHLQYLVKTAN